MNHQTDADLRRHVIELLEGGSAHIKFVDAVHDFPLERAGIRPKGAAHSAWELLEHLRIAQADIVLFSSAGFSQYISTDLGRYIKMIKDEGRSLLEPFAWAKGRTLLREALLIADHNSYHVGQLVLVRSLISASE